MRCICCDKILSDFEATIKSEVTGEYMDTCSKCLSTIPEVGVIVREDLLGCIDISDEGEMDDF